MRLALEIHSMNGIFIFIFSVASFVEKLVRLLAVVNHTAEETIISCVAGTHRISFGG